MGESALLEGALCWAERGWRVHPLRPGEKRPLLTSWPTEATTEESQIRRWWEGHSDANVGIATGEASGLVVLDVDPRNGGNESLTRLGPIPETFRVETGGGGRHYYFHHEPGLVSSKIAPGVELKSSGHQVVAPPSVHPSGNRYVCEDPEAPIAPPPAWLRQGTSDGAAKPERSRGRVSTLLREGVAEGARNESASYLVRYLARKEIPPDVATAVLELWNATRNRPPIDESAVDEKSVADIVRSNYRTIQKRTKSDEREPLSIRPLSEVEPAPETPSGPIPKLSASGRVVMLAGREKSGKSTLLGAGVAAVSRGGRFLGTDAEPGLTLYVKPPSEGHPSDFRRIVESFGGDLTRVLVMDRIMWPDDPVAELGEAVRTYEPDLLIIDTLSSTFASLDLDPGRSSDWAPILSGLTELTQDHDLATVIIHHARKSDGSYRDSTQIGANVDMILEMYPVKHSPTRRRIQAKGRWPLETFYVQFVTAQTPYHFELVDQRETTEESLRKRVIAYVRNHPGCSSQEVRKEVTGRGNAIRETLGQLEKQKQVENRGESHAHKWHFVEQPILREDGDTMQVSLPGLGASQ